VLNCSEDRLNAEKYDGIDEATLVADSCYFFILIMVRVRQALMLYTGHIKISAIVSSTYSEFEDHVWFADRWMVASLCDE
jgi:hypothetical protein